MSKEGNKRKKKTVIIIILAIILFLIVIGGIFIIILKSKNENNKSTPVIITENKYFSPTEEQLEQAEELTRSPIRITCGNSETATPGFSYTLMKGEYTFCTFSIMTYIHDEISQIWFDYDLNDNFKYVDSHLIDGKTQWTTSHIIKDGEVEEIKENEKMSFLFNDVVVDNYYNFFLIKTNFIGNTYGYFDVIYLSNIVLKTKNGKYYKYLERTSADGHINIMDSTKYVTKNGDNKILFYKYDNNEYKQINTYTCDEKYCGVGGYYGAIYNDLNSGKTIINDKKPKLYDFEKGILVTFDKVTGSLERKYRDNSQIEFILGEINDTQYIYDLGGKEIKSLKGYDEFKTLQDKMLISNVYSVENNLIVLSKNGKKGIAKITEDNKVINFKYDDIKLFDNKYFKAKENNKWNVYELDTGNKISNEDYKQLFIAAENVMVVQIDDYLYIKDFKGNNLIEDKIRVLYDYQEFPAQFAPWGISVVKYEDNIVDICVTSGPRGQYGEEFDIYRYKYNIKEKTLTSINE